MLKRNLEIKIKYLLSNFPVVAIIGARQTGKTTLSKQIAPSWKYIDLENPNDFARIEHDPLFFFDQYPSHIIIDEAQSYPDLFKVLRGVIDSQREEKNRFLLTGSSSPELLANISETLAGRIAIVELGTLKANEFYQQPLSDFYDLFNQKLNSKFVVSGDAPLTISRMQNIWLHGGYPEPNLSRDESFFSLWMQQYRDTYINRDIARLFPRLNKFTYQRFLMILSKLSGTIINRSDVARTLEINEKTVREYLTIAEKTFLWRQLPSFEKNIIKAIVKMPKGYIRDCGLLHNLLRIQTLDELQQHPIIGHSFESFVIEEIIKGLQATNVTNWDACYYRTRNGTEIDLILDGSFGTLPIEIKYGSRVDYKQLRSLESFIEEHQLPFGILINQSKKVEWLTAKIVQIPVGWL
jgi:uncharacterized protein